MGIEQRYFGCGRVEPISSCGVSSFDEIAAGSFIIKKLFKPAMAGRCVIDDDIRHQPEVLANGVISAQSPKSGRTFS